MKRIVGCIVTNLASALSGCLKDLENPTYRFLDTTKFKVENRVFVEGEIDAFLLLSNWMLCQLIQNFDAENYFDLRFFYANIKSGQIDHGIVKNDSEHFCSEGTYFMEVTDWVSKELPQCVIYTGTVVDICGVMYINLYLCTSCGVRQIFQSKISNGIASDQINIIDCNNEKNSVFSIGNSVYDKLYSMCGE